MTLYITKNGQQLGPYSLEETRGYVRTGILTPADLAWYEGLTTWIPLAQVPGFAAQAPAYAGGDAPRERPVLVWVICIVYFILVFFSLISMALIPILTHLLNTLNEHQHNVGMSLTAVDYSLSILTLGLILTGAILLFLLRRQALYFFAASFMIRIVSLIYSIVAKDSWHVIGRNAFTLVVALTLLFIVWGLNLAVLGYTWHLARTRVLR